MMTKIPPYLKKGDMIGLVCPAGFMSIEKSQACINVLREWGYQVKVGASVTSNSANYFSGNDQERLQDLQAMLDDDQVNAILCARGGYGTGRIIEQINFAGFIRRPKWIIGFSDVSILHAHLYSNYKIASLHAPMAAAFNEGGHKNEFVLSLRKALSGKKAKYTCRPHPFNRRGEAVGELVGGNLTLLAHLIGSSSDFKTRGRILFLEDTGEYLYNIDRMFYQLKRSGKLSKLAGLIIGGFTPIKDTERPFGLTFYEMVRDVVEEYDFPVCFDFPVSHEKENLALKIGLGYKLKVNKSKVVLEE